jgi:hypothetical protein
VEPGGVVIFEQQDLHIGVSSSGGATPFST